MRTFRMGVVAALLSLAFVGVTASVASAASLHSLWVNKAFAPSAPSNSCTHPGYRSISSAIAAAEPGANIYVCTGTYTEQLQITRAVSIVAVDGTVTVALPASPADATTSCDRAIDAAVGGTQPDQDGISICGPGTVKMTGITVRTLFPSSYCYDNEYGILVGGGATLDFIRSAETAAGVSFGAVGNGCQGGVGIQAGLSKGAATYSFNNDSPVTVGHISIKHSTFSGYQKNGITVDGTGSTLLISTATLTGNGPSDNNAQNAIQVSDGASASIARAAISDNEYEGGNDATGILFYGSGGRSKVSDSTIADNDYGVYSLTAPGSASAVSISGSRFYADRDVALAVDEGFTTATNNTISGGMVGIQAEQYEGQTYGVHAVTSYNRVSGMSTASVQVSSDALGSPHDVAGYLSVTHSIIIGRVLNNSRNFDLVLSDNT